MDSQLIGSGKVEQACILGHDGGLWATSPGFAPGEGEIAAIVRGYQQPESLHSAGLTISNEKVVLLPPPLSTVTIV